VVQNVMKHLQDEMRELILQSMLQIKPEEIEKPKTPTQNQFLPSYLLKGHKDAGVQTESVNAVDFLESKVEAAEIYKFDWKAQRLMRVEVMKSKELILSVSIGDEMDVIEITEFANRYGNMSGFYAEAEEKATD